MPRSSRPLADRFWEKVIQAGPDDCWLWLGAKRYGGYGVIGAGGAGGGRHMVATHVSLLLAGVAVPDGMHVLHRCDNPSCVNPKHLWLGSREDNMRDASRKGRMAMGVDHGRSKLTHQQARAIRASKKTHRELAEKYGVTPSQVSNIQLGKHWRLDRTVAYVPPGQRKGAKHGMARLTDDQVRSIRSDLRNLQPIADEYGISIAQVSNIRLRKRWGHVV
jgi:hypothetical protein